MRETNILVVDDEKEIADLLEIYLISDGFHVKKAYSAMEGLKMLQEQPIDLVLLDVMMPDMDGITMCRRIRETNNIPIIMVSAKTQELDKIVGLTNGADDYVSKPFNPLELMARVKSQLRRYRELNPSRPQENKEVITLKNLEINKVTHQVIFTARASSSRPLSLTFCICWHPIRAVCSAQMKSLNVCGTKSFMRPTIQLWYISAASAAK